MVTKIFSTKHIWESVNHPEDISVVNTATSFFRTYTMFVDETFGRTSSEFKYYRMRVHSVYRKGRARSIGHVPLSFEDKLKIAKKKLNRMSVNRKKKLAKETRGIWMHYPDDWLERIREGYFESPYTITTNSDYVIYC